MSQPRIAAVQPRISQHRPSHMAQAPRIAATPRTRGRKLQRVRIAWLSANPLCTHCQAEGRTTQAQQVDHTIPLWKGGRDDDTNFTSLCIPHHAAKTKQEVAERAKGA